MDSSAKAAALSEAALIVWVTQILICCTFSVAIWEWVISLPKEFHFIWKKHWNATTYIYVGCRYYLTFISLPIYLWIQVSNTHTWDECGLLFRIPAALLFGNTAFSEGILLMRAYNMLGRRKIVLWICMPFLALFAAYQIHVSLMQIQRLPFFVAPFEKGPCLLMPTPDGGSPHVMACFLLPVFFDLAITLLTAAHALRLRKQSGDKKQPLLNTFVKEGIIYAILISSANLINAIFIIQPQKSLSPLLIIPLSVGLPNLFACRLVLQQRERADLNAQRQAQATICGNRVLSIPQWNTLPVGLRTTDLPGPLRPAGHRPTSTFTISSYNGSYHGPYNGHSRRSTRWDFDMEKRDMGKIDSVSEVMTGEGNSSDPGSCSTSESDPDWGLVPTIRW